MEEYWPNNAKLKLKSNDFKVLNRPTEEQKSLRKNNLFMKLGKPINDGKKRKHETFMPIKNCQVDEIKYIPFNLFSRLKKKLNKMEDLVNVDKIFGKFTFLEQVGLEYRILYSAESL